ncbi:MAG TPA: hypothetical protein VGP11_06535, partial [Acidimicrobiales bacterium]|nr:hypothetical protein [Acidimicrobiales bacterium]
VTATSYLDGNELYGAGFAVAFAETLKAEGRNVTRDGFVKTLESIKLDDPAITPLQYSTSNHQGMEGGVIAKIAANGGKVPVVADLTNTTVFTSNNVASTPLKQVSNLLFSPIPSWLK